MNRQVRAVHTGTTITVYQAYSPAIARPALEAQRFTGPFKRERMTWIKPSFLWMMYRCGWATKPGQETVLAVELRRDGFDWALATAGPKPSPVRVQWDPERDLHLRPLPETRSLQLGLSGVAVDRYVDEWTVAITDVTPLARRVHELVQLRNPAAARELLPAERIY